MFEILATTNKVIQFSVIQDGEKVNKISSKQGSVFYSEEMTPSLVHYKNSKELKVLELKRSEKQEVKENKPLQAEQKLDTVEKEIVISDSEQEPKDAQPIAKRSRKKKKQEN